MAQFSDPLAVRAGGQLVMAQNDLNKRPGPPCRTGRCGGIAPSFFPLLLNQSPKGTGEQHSNAYAQEERVNVIERYCREDLAAWKHIASPKMDSPPCWIGEKEKN